MLVREHRLRHRWDYPLKGIIERVREALIGTEVKAGDWRIDHSSAGAAGGT